MAVEAWITGRGALPLDRPRILGIVNVTPDSFYDGGLHASVEAAVAHAERLLAEGADILDVGGESTRPGARGVPAGEELDRVVPVVRELVRRFPETPIAIDTVKAEVAEAALAAGACIVNDVSGFRLDLLMPDIVRAGGAGVILMHSRGGVGEMASYALATYGDDPVGEILEELARGARVALDAGIPAARVALDPGLGFSKRTEHSIAVLAQLDRFAATGLPIVLGPSRKRFVGEVVAGGLPVGERLEGTIAACVAGFLGGARLFRVHDVAPVRRALAVADAVWRAR